MQDDESRPILRLGTPLHHLPKTGHNLSVRRPAQPTPGLQAMSPLEYHLLSPVLPWLLH